MDISPKETTNEEKQGLNLKEIFYKYISFSWLFLLVMAVSLISCWLYLRYTNLKFSAAASLMIQDKRSSGPQAQMFEDLFMMGGNDNVKNEVEVLKSRSLMERVVKSFSLDKTYYAKGKIKNTNVYEVNPLSLEIIRNLDSANSFQLEITVTSPDGFLLKQDGKNYAFGQPIRMGELREVVIRKSEKGALLQKMDYILGWQPLEATATNYSNLLFVKQIDNFSGILDLSITTDNPYLSRDILNQLLLEYDKSNIEDKNKMGANTIRFIDERLAILEDQLGDVEKKLQEFKQNNEVIDLEAQSSSYFDTYKETDKELIQQEVKLKVLDLLTEYITDRKNTYEKVPTNLGIEDPVLLNQVGQFNQLISSREIELQTARPQSPRILEMEGGIAKLRKDIIENLSNIRKSYVVLYNDLSKRKNKVQSSISSVPQRERELRDRMRQQNIKQELYLFLLQKREENSIAIASSISNSRVVDKAVLNESPVFPKKYNVYAMGVLLGLLIPIIIIYILELLNDKITNRKDIEKITKASIIGEIGHSNKPGSLVIAQNERSVIAEQFRIIRTNLQFIISKIDIPTIMVTSSFSGEGKSFASLNLGATIALTGKKTAVLEFDLRKPRIVAGLHIQRKKGITNYLMGDATIEEMLLAVPEVNNLFIVPCGPIPPNPAELLLDEKVAEMFAELKKRFDCVIIDTAPVGLVSDAMVLGKFADCSLFIVRHRYTYKRQINLINEIYMGGKLPKASIIINDIRLGGVTGYYGYGKGYYGHSYGYGYGYGHGYYTDDRKPSRGFSLPFLKKKKKR